MLFDSSVLALLLVFLNCRTGDAALLSCAGGTDQTCIDGLANSFTCDSGTGNSNLCLCHDNYEENTNGDACVAKDCSAGSNVCTATESVCTGASGSQTCGCRANYKEDAEASCAAIVCTTATNSLCTDEDANSYCDATTDANNPVCACKKLFDGTGAKDCSATACDVLATCTTIDTNSYCTGTTLATDTCRCIGTFTADATTGTCTKISCAESATSTTITSSCGANTVCEAQGSTYQCFCKTGYSSTGSATCVQPTCTTDTVGSICGDATSYICNSNTKCECASGYVASGSKCKKSCTASSECNTNAACVNSICECNVNYQGNGATCTALTCTSTDVTTCHANSQCTGTTCGCATGYVADGTVCKKSCTADSGCATNALCVSSKCECKATYVGDGGNTCVSVACAANTDCTLENSSCNTTTSACMCADGYQFGTTTIECVKSGASAVVFNFTFMAVSFLMAAFFNKM